MECATPLPVEVRLFGKFVFNKEKIDELSSVTDWVSHDLRRTVGSEMAALGVAPHVADKVLNHQTGTAVYQRHEFLVERKKAVIAWGPAH
jgi:hypothetical protein